MRLNALNTLTDRWSFLKFTAARRVSIGLNTLRGSDPGQRPRLTLIGSAAVSCATTLAACYLPARRAAKLDPAIAIMEQ